MWELRASILGLVTLFCLIQRSIQLSTNATNTYVAAVVEYAAEGDVLTETPLDIIRRNWVNYENYMEQADRRQVDIIVFPECGLTTMNIPANRTQILPFLTPIPDPKDKINPCNDTASNVPEILRNVSCAAQDKNMYVVINLDEIFPCSSQQGCPPDGVFIYNTNVAFDRNGVIIARYRKYNLFVEPGFDVTSQAELSTFETDFGVRFGMIICFDLIFKEPAVRLARELGVTDIVFSAAWFSELPFLTATQVQAAWSYAFDINLLASGFSNPPNGNSGSGIYAGKIGTLNVIMPLTKTNQLIVATVTKKKQCSCRKKKQQNITQITEPSDVTTLQFEPQEITTSTIGNLRLYQDDFRPYTTKLIEEEDNNTTTVLVNSNLVCHFNITVENQNDSRSTGQVNGDKYYYRIAAFNGVRNFVGTAKAGIQVCGVIPCRNKDDVTSCGLGLNSTAPAGGTAFKSIHIHSQFQKHEAVLLPYTLTKNLLPLPRSAFQVVIQPEDGRVQADMHTTKDITSLLSFALYNRVFNRDGLISTPKQS